MVEGLILGFLLFILLMIFVCLFLLIFWIVMIIDCAKRKFKEPTDKIVWILVLLFLNIIGAVIYYFVVKRK